MKDYIFYFYDKNGTITKEYVEFLAKLPHYNLIKEVYKKLSKEELKEFRKKLSDFYNSDLFSEIQSAAYEYLKKFIYKHFPLHYDTSDFFITAVSTIEAIDHSF